MLKRMHSSMKQPEGTLNKAYGETATADEIIGKVTTTAPDDKVKTKEVVGTIPATGRDQKVK